MDSAYRTHARVLFGDAVGDSHQRVEVCRAVNVDCGRPRVSRSVSRCVCTVTIAASESDLR